MQLDIRIAFLTQVLQVTVVKLNKIIVRKIVEQNKHESILSKRTKIRQRLVEFLLIR